MLVFSKRPYHAKSLPRVSHRGAVLFHSVWFDWNRHMWCVTCKADVAAEVSTESGQVKCATCGQELAQAHAIRERTKDARQILERWSNKSLMDPYGPLPGTRHRATEPVSEENDSQSSEKTSAIEDSAAARGSARSVEGGRDSESAVNAGRSRPVLRIDRPARVQDVTGSPNRLRSHRRPVSRHIDGPHGKELAGPHFQAAPPKQPSWAVATGQWLAYIGVLALTIGTAVVVYGHFGGYANYTPTGWLITTVGQMLLFLGVINLVSGGMEQSNDEVSQRIEVIGERLLRIEAATDEVLRGPQIPAERYAEGPSDESGTRNRHVAEQDA